ncbi:MAG TPA: zf-HC2 domain-containing protein [Candidatus Binataceae bacterium]|nr:zf-HC2 domain-containing protein [Candidatus Binataceae bacterium]
MAQCDDIASLLGAFEDGELAPQEMHEVALHLASCKNCDLTLAAYANLGGLLRDAAPAPSLDGFATAVQARIERLRPPLRVRLGRWFEDLRERYGNAAAMAFAMGAAAVLTVVLTTPLARNMLGARERAIQVAARDAKALKDDTGKSLAEMAAVASREPSAIISKLETSNPDVAVWSEPSQDTTVIWLPDQQP